MRHPGDSTAGRSASRPRDPASGQTSGRRGRSAGSPPPARRPAGGRPADGSSGAGPDGDQSVFVPGYRSERPGAPAGRGAGPSAPVTAWSAPVAGRRGWPGPDPGLPAGPGQPPPLYPPGQFAAWNRPDGRVAVADPDSAWPAAPGSDWSQDRPWPAEDALAVSEPSADVTATGTWRTFSDGPDDGTWSGPRGGAGAQVPAQAPPPAGELARDGLDAAAVAGGWRRHGTGPGRGRRDDSRATERIRRHDPRGQHRADDRRRRRRVGGRPPSLERKGSSHKNSPPRGPATKGATARGKKKGRSSVVLAVSAVVVLAVAAAAFLLYTASHQNSPSVAAPTSPKATRHQTASASPSPTPTDHILSRTADPLPLSVIQLFPVRFTGGGRSFARTATRTQKNCPAAIVGSRLQAAVKAAKCSQVIRASYVAAAIKVMGTIGVLNLSTSQQAAKAGHAVGGVRTSSPCSRAARGSPAGWAGAPGSWRPTVKGHYLILMWAQFTTHHRPRKATQKTRLENFMKNLFEQTANVSLTRRMVDGTP